MNSGNQAATRNDVEEIVERVVTRSVDGATSKILSAVGEQLRVMNDDIDNRFDELDDKLSSKIDRLERKVDTVTDNLGGRVSKLEKAQSI